MAQSLALTRSNWSRLLVSYVVLLFVQCGPSGGQEKAPLYIFEPENDLFENYDAASGRLDYVENGEVTFSSYSNPEDANTLPIPARINITSFSFLVLAEGITVNLTLKSLNTSRLGDPLLSIPSTFVFPSCPYRVLFLFPCNGSVYKEGEYDIVLINFTINAYTHDKEYDPIVLYLSKFCNGNAPPELIGAKEFPRDPSPFLSITGNRGCYNDTDLPIKPPTARSTPHTSPGTVVAAVVIPAVLLIVIIIILVTIFLLFRQRSKKLRVDEFTIDRMAETYQALCHPLFDRIEALKKAGPHEKEFSSEKISFVRELGEGAFGRVYQGMAANIIAGEDSTIVAVKQLKSNTSGDDGAVVDFFKEVTFMSELDHPRILKLLGVCSVTEPYCMIFEYMDLGDLNSYLRSAIGLGPDCDEALNKETCFLQLSDLLSIVEQIAEGMEYLSNQKLVHRDLATRNCLVATGLEVKISDFGLSRDVNTTDYYRIHGHAVLPIRWMAPESIMYGKFTTATDVWSFGVVVWEVFTYGQQPYVGMTNEEVINFVTKQGTLEPPSGCPQKVASIMTQCWSQSPGSRPSFSKLLTTIKQLPSILKDIIYDSPDYPAIRLN